MQEKITLAGKLVFEVLLIILGVLGFLRLYRQDILELMKPLPKDKDQDKK
jgi:hypothetical protein